MLSRIGITLSVVFGLLFVNQKPAEAKGYLVIKCPDAYAGLQPGYVVKLVIKDGTLQGSGTHLAALPVFASPYLKNGDKATATAGSSRVQLPSAPNFLPNTLKLGIEVLFYREIKAANQPTKLEHFATLSQELITKYDDGDLERRLTWNQSNPPGGVTEFTVTRSDYYLGNLVRLYTNTIRDTATLTISFTKTGPYQLTPEQFQRAKENFMKHLAKDLPKANTTRQTRQRRR